MTSRMFSFITDTWNPIAGGPCIWDCDYCWATALKEKNDWDKYKGPYRIHDRAMKVRFKPDDFVFVCDMTDIGSPEIPRSVLIDVFETIKFSKDTKFLLLTKNPYWYVVWEKHLPENVYLGATIETDLDHTVAVSGAPQTKWRLECMEALKRSHPDRPRFVSVEPIMAFSRHFAEDLIKLEPWGVAVGYDNYDNGLREPTLMETEMLIHRLIEADVTVYQKTIREARQ